MNKINHESASPRERYLQQTSNNTGKNVLKVLNNKKFEDYEKYKQGGDKGRSLNQLVNVVSMGPKDQ